MRLHPAGRGVTVEDERLPEITEEDVIDVGLANQQVIALFAGFSSVTPNGFATVSPRLRTRPRIDIKQGLNHMRVFAGSTYRRETQASARRCRD